MINHISSFRDKLAAGQLCLGTGITTCDPAIVEALAPSVDFLWIDLEHNPIGIETLLSHLIAARAGGAPALVRVPNGEPGFLKRVLDTGVEGIIVPQVRSADEVRQFVETSRYRPLGKRGWGPRRPSNYGRRSQDQILAEANELLFLAVQIENMDAVRAIDEIVAVAGIDGIVIGPYDLSASMGILGQLDDGELLATIQTVVDKGRNRGLSIGFGDEANAESAARWVQMGAQWVQAGSELSYMLSKANHLFQEIRGSEFR